ncbi:PEP-CTERM sorting domain-containing protein [Dendronalium sp. ChiSLP03b]|uniref:PEP-CTERM sorting domain-containing protein n=1 Tax=Dendronalium sp. ChiSLP03b TaxID=3075381 RepID=UPI002AD56158|nr:PEP-CTERM sorting domain-containing protein [Dendronalium sp. ChiSLP03b]MDZ8206558.1 PEP-CTERM sorting domain-containing protein [Dendronalium sp. ChiSLP03b]
MKLTKKISIIFFSVTTTLVSTTVIANTYNAAAQAAELVKNGSFELDPLVDPNNPNATNPNVTGWTKSGDPMDISGIRMSNFPQSGNQGLSLSGFIDLSYISQTLSTQPGVEYELSYYLASIDEAPDLDNQFQTFVGGKKIFDRKGISFQPYTQYKFNFTADASSTELKFGNWDRKGFLYLDNVSVKAVPEPLTISGTAIAGLLGLWLKKKRFTSSIEVNK